MFEMKDFSLEGKVALITGASYGIGFAIAPAYTKAGATIVFNDIKQELVDKGSRLAISDVGCGVQALRGAILSAQLNVIINVGLMKDKEYAKALDEKCEALVKEGVEICDAVYDKVIAAMR